jgi:uncharacterized protein (DUF2384 family)
VVAEERCATVFAAAKEIWQNDKDAVSWLIEDNIVLGEAPIETILRGDVQRVRDLLGQIEYGVCI